MSSGPSFHETTTASTVTLSRGASIGRYVVLGLVGRGGMGEVYAAYDPELDRKVAVKLLRVKPGNGVSLTEGRQRTLREAQAIARLSHPNVVVVYDVGTFEDKVFIAMEFVEGNTVTFWLQNGNRTWQDVVKVFMAAGRGLTAAHEKGLVHRDFKPDNVMVGRDGQVRVMDFGLARNAEKPTVLRGGNDGALTGSGKFIGNKNGANGANGTNATQIAHSGSSATDLPVIGRDGRTHSTQRMPVVISEHSQSAARDPMATMVLNAPGVPAAVVPDPDARGNSGMFDVRLTRTGAMMGTPAYMAPEQFLGQPTDGRTDQFSFCISMYEALYGERPFAGNSMSTLTTNVVQGNINEPPANSKVPLWVRKILLRGLQPQPARRWESMDTLIDALGKDPRIARRRWAIAMSAVCMMVVAGLGIRHSVVEHRAVCLGGAEKLAGIWEIPSSGEPAPLTSERIRKSFLATGKSYAVDVFNTVSRSLTAYAQNWANMYRDSCEATQVRGEQSSDVLDLRTECLQERLGGLRALTDVFADANGEVVENAVSAANNLSSLDRCADIPLLRAVVRPPEDPGTRVQVEQLRKRLTELKARLDAGRFKEAAAKVPGLVTEARNVGYQPLTAEALALAGNISTRSEDAAAAEKAFVESYFISESSRHDEVRAEDAAMLVYVVGYQESRFDQARQWATTADAILRRLGGHDLLRAWLFNDIGAAHFAEGKKEPAVQAMQSSLALKVKALGSDHPDVGVSEGNLAIVLAESGHYLDALQHSERSLALLERGLGAEHPYLAEQMSNRGEILNALGRYSEARQSFERATAAWERELGSESRNLAYALTGMGISYLGLGAPTNALVPLERALKIRQARETNGAKRAETAFALARALWESHRDHSRARLLAEQARADYSGSNLKTKVEEVNAWLSAHNPASGLL
jgi:serine/threonine protein kinase/tetratricopeptide (TPR) repeat protein